MNAKYYFLMAGILLSLAGSSQQTRFEGEIRYQHYFTGVDPRVDTARLVESFGRASHYIYKDGNYKWTFEGSELEEEYYDSMSGDAMDKYTGSKVLVFRPHEAGDTLLSYQVTRNADTVCGILCDRLLVVIAPKDNLSNTLTRKIYFNRNLAINPDHFKLFYTFCSDQVFAITKSLPLRIEMSSPNFPFVLTMNAVEVKKRRVEKKETVPPADYMIVRESASENESP